MAHTVIFPPNTVEYKNDAFDTLSDLSIDINDKLNQGFQVIALITDSTYTHQYRIHYAKIDNQQEL